MKKVIYLYKSGQLLCKDYSLILKDKKDYVSYIPIEQIDTLICFGEISINKRTLSLLNKHNIVILFFNFYLSSIEAHLNSIFGPNSGYCRFLILF